MSQTRVHQAVLDLNRRLELRHKARRASFAELGREAIAAGVGYVPSPPTSRYVLDNVNNPSRSWPMDLSAVAFQPNGQRAAAADYERRYGPGTAGTGFKRWEGPGNEVRFVVIEALRWRYRGEPTEQEITDAQACNDSIYRSYMVAVEPGWSPERPIHINDPSRPHGLLQHTDPFWGLTLYEFNEATQVEPPPPPPPGDTPPVDQPPAPAPTPGLSTPEQRTAELWTLLAPLWDAFQSWSVFTRRLPTSAALWPAARPVITEAIKAARRYALRSRVS